MFIAKLRFTHQLAILLVFVLGDLHLVLGIDCFKCVSENGSNPGCEDPFHNNFTTTILEAPCYSGRKNREGVFPATACVKLNGIFNSGRTMVVRDCALDSGTLTTDTEIVRMSHCGGFYFDNEYVSGCVQSCFEDACNAAIRTSSSTTTSRLVMGTLLSMGLTILCSS